MHGMHIYISECICIVNVAFWLGLVYIRMHQQVAYYEGVVWCKLSWHKCREVHDKK